MLNNKDQNDNRIEQLQRRRYQDNITVPEMNRQRDFPIDPRDGRWDMDTQLDDGWDDNNRDDGFSREREPEDWRDSSGRSYRDNNVDNRNDRRRQPWYGPGRRERPDWGGAFPEYPMGPPRGEMPSGPPPQRRPERRMDQPGLYRVDRGAIRQCRYRYTYIWLENGRSFWAWLTFIGRNSVAGYRWTGYRWVYFGTDMDIISDFMCY